MTKQTQLKIMMFCSMMMAAEVAESRCSDGIATTSMYFIPHIKDYCKGSTPCKKFKKEVKMQGSGTLPGNKLLTYTGKTISLGSCDTAFGASGNCLIPFISVAADADHYQMGDIIEMPSLRGKIFTLPNGKHMVHPGYLIVHDTGGAIKGKGRFDFFTGSYAIDNWNNPFGLRGAKDVRMVDTGECSLHKQYSVIRRETPNYESSLAAIENATRNISTSAIEVMVAAVGGVR
ncbi:3D domain-containing protein [Bdellovibrio sp. 22V]|uniref:3D domain-containing protein n=1 Tax=Bdellovibrio TaxID=958 RepID=UPI002543B10D|nr:3D domain-containing protein [Bdellovibrio sp. 22V]WII73315.1 3D domain-containing protein [Bdellovibrio sp. 22V]